MKFPTISTLLLLPVLAVAQSSGSSTTTLTSTAHVTKTITVSQVVASVTSTFAAYNSTALAGPTAFGTGLTTAVLTSASAAGVSSSGPATSSPTIPSNFMGAASSLNAMYAGSAGVMVMIAAALL